MEKGSHKILRQMLCCELRKALGCTEPIAVSYAAAKAREVLGRFPERIELRCSGNIIKNVKSVTVPCSGGMKGLDVAAVLGAVGGDASKELEVLTGITDEDIGKTKELLAKEGFFSCFLIEGEAKLYITVSMWAADSTAEVTIAEHHTDIKQIKKDGKVIFSAGFSNACEPRAGMEQVSLEDIFTYAEQAPVDELSELLKPQIEMNTRISDYGLREDCGSNIGSTLLASFPNDVSIRARAKAAAGSDARMSGCALPVVINSGSGNQGITVSLPVLEYAKEWKVSEEGTYRALAISNLCAVYVKQYIGSLSAFCGAVTAASGVSAALCFMRGGTHEQMAQAMINTLASVGGIVCDGAKASCASKIASAVDAAILAFHLSMSGQSFVGGDGLVQASPEDSIKAIGRVGRVGMEKTDVEILNIMIGKA